ncbi:MAG: twin transmembrane helix small protein [Rhodospirillales bacterium]|nr:twin transmembrane helix small protein [Rhodospirillales bacterium]
MHNVFVVLMLLAATAVLGVLVVGIVGMLKGGEFNKKYGNKLMQARVILQGIALILFALAYMSR